MGEDRAKSLADPAERKRRRALLRKKHIAPLTNFVKQIRKKEDKENKIPYFDPLDGGINAKCLFVLEAPGQQAKDIDFISRNNPDETARNFFEFNREAGIRRKKTVTWNIVPWYLGTGKKIRAAKKSDIDKGLPYLYRLIDLLPKLRVIVLVGRKAKSIEKELEIKYSKYAIWHCHHPSPNFINRDKKRNKEFIINRLKKINKLLNLW
jgi:uracil-DNA glycosylase